jgi:RimJ/RimL family protein N-acetyltransferase
MTSGVDFELQPRLTGALVELRPLVPADFDALFRVASDPLIWEQHPEPDRHTPPKFRRYFDGAIASGGAFAVLARATGAVIGSTRYHNVRPDAREVEIGWTFLARSHWGGAYNREMKALLLAHAFRFVDRVVFVVGQNNRRSRRAVEKLGAVLEGTAEATSPDGTPRHNVVYALTCARWAAGAGAAG